MKTNLATILSILAASALSFSPQASPKSPAPSLTLHNLTTSGTCNVSGALDWGCYADQIFSISQSASISSQGSAEHPEKWGEPGLVVNWPTSMTLDQEEDMRHALAMMRIHPDKLFLGKPGVKWISYRVNGSEIARTDMAGKLISNPGHLSRAEMGEIQDGVMPGRFRK